MSIKNVDASRLLSQEGHHPDKVREHVQGLLGTLIARNQFHVLKANQKTHQAASGDRLAPVLSSVQGAIAHRISRLSQAPKAVQLPLPQWSNENVRLQAFYGFLGNSAKTQSAFKLCEAIRLDADHKIQGLPTAKDQQLAILLKAREQIGKVVFAADMIPDKLPTDIDPNNIEAFLQFVDGVVATKLKEVYQTLIAGNKLANSFSLQDPDMLLYIEKPKEIAKLLLTSQGQLNLGLINAIKEEFISSDPMEYEQGILFVLGQMDVSWQSAIDAVQAPNNASSRALVRADLGLLPDEEISALHAKQVVLGALLSQLCQGPVGDCFAVSWAIKKHNEFLLNSAQDYAALVRDGYLTRNVNGSPDHFFFETTIADDGLSAQLTLHSDGKVDEFQGNPFWQCPNLIAACRQMGMTDLDKRAPALLHQIFASGNEAKTLTWEEMILICAKASADSGHHEEAQAVLGRYGFSLANNRLLRAWETSLAAMAEDRSGDYVRDNVNSCVMAVLKHSFDKCEKKATVYQKTLIEELKQIFQKTFNDSFRLVYNGSIPLQHVSSDGSSSSGGFELYQRDVKDLNRKGVRIATPEQFRNFVYTMIEKASVTEMGKVAAQKDREFIASVVNALKLCVHGKNFVRDILWAYDDDNRKDSDPALHYRDLERTPMTSLDGDNPWEVMAIDTGKDFTPDIKTIRPKDPRALLQWLLGLASWKQSTEHYLTDSLTNEEDEATSPQHAFNIEFENEEFKAFLASGLSPDQWIQKTLVEPGLTISSAQMDIQVKQTIEQNVKGWLGDQLQNEAPESLVQEMETLFADLNSHSVSVQQYSQRLLDGLIKIYKLDHDQTLSLSLALDNIVLQALPADQLNAIQSSAFRFAKTNWDTGPKNLFFCAYFNPRTEQADFASISEDRTGLQPMDQHEWIDDKDWEVDPVAVKA